MYLDPPWTNPQGVTTKSSFWAALLDARAVTGRDADTGAVADPATCASWIGAIGYLCFIDEVGTAVYLASVGSPATTTGVLRALESFSTLSVDERDVVYALRNGLAHDYSLINVDQRNGRQERSHRFQLHAAPGPLAVLPQNRWDGSFQNLGPNEDTIVSLREVGDLAESIARSVIGAHVAGDLRIGLPGGANEMLARYFLQFRA
jgi:hypothetical protein